MVGGDDCPDSREWLGKAISLIARHSLVAQVYISLETFACLEEMAIYTV